MRISSWKPAHSYELKELQNALFNLTSGVLHKRSSFPEYQFSQRRISLTFSVTMLVSLFNMPRLPWKIEMKIWQMWTGKWTIWKSWDQKAWKIAGSSVFLIVFQNMGWKKLLFDIEWAWENWSIWEKDFVGFQRVSRVIFSIQFLWI